MIGQTNLLKSLIVNLPNFFILVGGTGTGKKELVKTLCKNKKLNYIPIKCTASEVDDLINNSENYNVNNLYCIYDCDKANNKPINALLKILEEPKNKNHYVMLYKSQVNIIDTIQNRGTVYKMEDYTINDLTLEAKKLIKNEKDFHLVMSIVKTINDIKVLSNMENVSNYYKFIVNIVDNLLEVDKANAYKVATYIRLNDDNKTKYDLELLLYHIRSYIDYIVDNNKYDDKDNLHHKLRLSILCGKHLDLLQKGTMSKEMCINSLITAYINGAF